MLFEIDWARGFAYRGRKGYIIKINPRGLYVRVKLRKIFLTMKNTRIMEV